MQYEIEFVHMPLAVYREVAAHLRQVEGVEATLLPQTATTFDYNQSQVGGIALGLAEERLTGAYGRVVQILNYYKQRYPLADDQILTTLANL